jgi:hypothetical protein
MYQVLKQDGISETFPNVEIALRMYLCMFVTNCSGERSFSTLNRVKSAIRTSMSDDRLNSLMLLSIESELLRCVDFSNIVADFASRKARKVKFGM